MKEKDDIDILIKKFVKGEMNEMEQASFELLLKEQPDLLGEVEFTRSLVQSTEKAEKERLHELLEKVGSDIETLETDVDSAPVLRNGPKVKFIRKNHWKKLAAIAAALMIFFAGWWLFNRASNNLATFQESAYIPPVGSSFRGPSDNGLSLAYRMYESGNHEESIAALIEIKPSDSLYILALFLYGHNEYKLGDFEPTVSTFNELLTIYKSNLEYILPNIDNAKWTKILALLSLYETEKNESRKTALQKEVEQFLTEAKPNDSYYQKAEELNKILN